IGCVPEFVGDGRWHGEGASAAGCSRYCSRSHQSGSASTFAGASTTIAWGGREERTPLSPEKISQTPGLDRQIRNDTLRHGHTALAEALEGGRRLTRTELARVLQGAGIAASGLRLAYLIMHAELDGILCSGPRRGKQFTYALLDDRAPGARSLPREKALVEL